MTPTVTYCPPAPAHFLEKPEPQFHKRGLAVTHAEMNGDGEVVSPYGLSWGDFSYMQVSNKNTATHRKKPIPLYATDHDALRRLLVRFMEIRAQLPGALKGPLPGTDAYRLRRSHIKLLEDVPRLDALATDLCHKYVEGKQSGMSAEELQWLEVEIEGVDTTIRMAKNLPEIIVGCVYLSYCCHSDSVTVAERFCLKPPAIRQLLARVAKVWARMQTEPVPPSAVGRLPKNPTAKLESARKSSANWYASLTEEERKARMDRNVAARRKRVSQPAGTMAVSQRVSA